MPISIETFFFDATAEGTLQQRIQQMIAQGILNGRFRPGERLPSSRKMAQHLGVSRITVTLAYTELVADDYLAAKGRSGYFVSENAPEPPAFPALRADETSVDWDRIIGDQPTPSLGLPKPRDWARFPYPFIYGQSDPTLFDTANWRLCAVQALGKRDFAALTSDAYDTDDPQLVEFIAHQTLPRRGILAGPDEILVTMGAQNALWLTAQILLDAKRKAVIENPCYPALRSIVDYTGCTQALVDVDGRGLPPENIPSGTDVVFVTPSHQSPTTVTMPMDRRRTLLETAEAQDFLIVEDDYEFEMTFGAAPSPSLKSLDKSGRVIHVGSFSKSLFPGLRLGYLVGPAPFIQAARALRGAILRHPPGHIQRTVSYYLSRGHYDAQVRRMSRAYHDRRGVLLTALQSEGLPMPAEESVGGSSLWLEAPRAIDTSVLAARLSQQGVLIEPGVHFFASSPSPKYHYRIAFSSIPKERIAKGIGLIAAETNKLLAGG